MKWASLFCMKYCGFIFISLIFSCSPIKKIRDRDIDPITSKFSGLYNNRPYFFRVKDVPTKYDSATTLLQLFDISGNTYPELDSIQISFDPKGQLQLLNKNSSIFQPIAFKGAFSREGYYEIYLSNEKIEIPPVLHFLFSSHDIKRLRIYITKSGDVVVDYYNYNTGNFLFIGGEGPEKKQFFFPRFQQ